MLIVDAHVHIWATSKPSPAHRQLSELSADELLREMDEADIDAAVIQPPAWDTTSNEVAVEAARRHPLRFAVLGFVLKLVAQASSLIFLDYQTSEDAYATDRQASATLHCRRGSWIKSPLRPMRLL